MAQELAIPQKIAQLSKGRVGREALSWACPRMRLRVTRMEYPLPSVVGSEGNLDSSCERQPIQAGRCLF